MEMLRHQMYLQEPLQALYLHIPFCVRKCSYCDFYSLPINKLEIVERYIERLVDVIQAWGMSLPFVKLKTIYIGGGTPSLLSGPMIEKILETTGKAFKIAENPEISMEINPATMPIKKTKDFINAGINRMSLGVQSFQEKELKLLGRLHGREEVFQTIENINDAGLSHYNLDFIYGIPGQTLESFTDTLNTVLACDAEHLSFYLLQMDNNVPLQRRIDRGELAFPDDDTICEMYYLTDDLLAKSGYFHYEISNFAKAGAECLHNLFYWDSQPYLGLGAGAVSFLNGKRFKLSCSLEEFLKGGSFPEDNYSEVLEEMKTQKDRLADAMIMGLRRMNGVNNSFLKERFGIGPEDVFIHELLDSVRDGLLENDEGNYRLTKKGWFLSNQVMWKFV